MKKFNLESLEDLIYLLNFLDGFFNDDLSNKDKILYATIIKEICNNVIEEAKNANRL